MSNYYSNAQGTAVILLLLLNLWLLLPLLVWFLNKQAHPPFPFKIPFIAIMPLEVYCKVFLAGRCLYKVIQLYDLGDGRSIISYRFWTIDRIPRFRLVTLVRELEPD